MPDLQGKVAIVTGGSVGIGRHYVNALVREGARVAVVDIVEPTDECLFDAAHARLFLCDVSQEDDVIRTVANIVKWTGGADILVNNAALFANLEEAPIDQTPTDIWDKVMAVNLRGPFLMVKHTLPFLRASKAGKIVNIGSGSASKGMPLMCHYVTSKAGILGMTRTLSRELGADGICVNTLSPGLVMSDSILANQEHLDTNRERVVKSRALARDAFPDDLIGALVFLCSDASNFVTGQTLAVDGGSINL